MEFIKKYDNNYQRNVYTLEGKCITLTISRERVYKKDKWQSVGKWKVTYYNNPHTHELDGRMLVDSYETLKGAKQIAIHYIENYDYPH